jgi:hypothetical protein
MTRRAFLDGVIADVCMLSGMQPTANSKAMAASLGLRLKPTSQRAGAALEGREVFYDRRLSEAEQHALVGRCIALHALRKHWLRNDPDAVSYVARGIRQEPERRRSGILPLVVGDVVGG